MVRYRGKSINTLLVVKTGPNKLVIWLCFKTFTILRKIHATGLATASCTRIYVYGRFTTMQTDISFRQMFRLLISARFVQKIVMLESDGRVVVHIALTVVYFKRQKAYSLTYVERGGF